MSHTDGNKDIRSQGALLLLQDLLDWMSNCGFPTDGGWSPNNKIHAKLGKHACHASVSNVSEGMQWDI